MQSKLWIAILITTILGSSLSTGICAQENTYEIIKFVRLQDGKAIDVKEDVKIPIEIRDPIGRDRTPEGGIKKGYKVELDYYLHCGPEIGIALKANDGSIFWMNSDTSIQIKDRYIKVAKGEIYTKAEELRLKLADGTPIDSAKDEFYLNVGNKENQELSYLYLFEGEIRIGSYTLSKQKPLAEIDAGQINLYYPDETHGGIEKRAETWRKSIKRLTTPFWRRSSFYYPASVIAATAVGILSYRYFTREPEVIIDIIQ